MYQINMAEPSQRFRQAWNAAGHHLQKHVQEGMNWIRADLAPPISEHLSFRLGNQLFFVYVAAAEFENDQPALDFFLRTATEATAIPCIMPMTEQSSAFVPSNPGSGLIHAETRKPINPVDLVSDDLIEISDWELHDFAIQVVRTNLAQDGKDICSYQSSLHIDPSIWFEESGNMSWVIVRAARYPETEAPVPLDIPEIKERCSQIGQTGFFASVIVGNGDDLQVPLAKETGNFMRIYRGHGMFVKYEGLKSL